MRDVLVIHKMRGQDQSRHPEVRVHQSPMASGSLDPAETINLHINNPFPPPPPGDSLAFLRFSKGLEPPNDLEITDWITVKAPFSAPRFQRKSMSQPLLESNVDWLHLIFLEPWTSAPSTRLAPFPTKQALLCNILHFVKTRLFLPQTVWFNLF